MFRCLALPDFGPLALTVIVLLKNSLQACLLFKSVVYVMINFSYSI